MHFNIRMTDIIHSIEYYSETKIPWTDSDSEKAVNAYIIDGKDIIWIANQLKRTPGSVAFRLKALGRVKNAIAARGYTEYKESELYKYIVENNSKVKKVIKPTTGAIITIMESTSKEPEIINKIGAPWSKYEEETLLKEIAEGKTHSEIAKLHGRKDGGIAARLKKLAIEMRVKKMSYDEIKSKTGLADYVLRKILKNDSLHKEEKVKQTITNEEIYDLLLELNKKLNSLIEKVS